MTSRYTVSGKIQQRDWLLKSQVSGKTMSPTCELTFAVTRNPAHMSVLQHSSLHLKDVSSWTGQVCLLPDLLSLE